MHGNIRIPDYEYKERVSKAAALLQRDGLDALIVNGTEADYATQGIFQVLASFRAWGSHKRRRDAALMVGPRAELLG